MVVVLEDFGDDIHSQFDLLPIPRFSDGSIVVPEQARHRLKISSVGGL